MKVMGVALLVAVVASGCGRLRQRQGIGLQPNKAESKEQREEDRQLAASGAEQAKKLGRYTQSALTVVARGNQDCFTEGRPNYAAAHTAYTEALNLEPNNAYVMTAQATCYARMGLELKFSGKKGQPTKDRRTLLDANRYFNRSLAAARAALVANPEYGSATLVTAEVYALTDRPEKAIEVLNTMEEQNLIPRGLESGFYAWRAYAKSLVGQAPAEDAQKAAEFYDPVEFAEFADRLVNPLDYKGVPPSRVPVAPWP